MYMYSFIIKLDAGGASGEADYLKYCNAWMWMMTI